ncbi:MAG: TIGR02921 family PEP-CTERM protein [Cyanobacteria bacterium SBLK]|nr:TIGR02921 family PEP-CTERM protein [Cyanobacteria bacterium SBLK]
MKNILHGIYHGIFWLWNLVFLILVYAGLLPEIGVPLTKAVLAGEIEREFLVTFVGLLLIPLICTAIGWMRFRKRSPELMRLFYGIEAPLILLCLVRLFILRELTPASTLLLGTAIACTIAFAGELLFGYLGQLSNGNRRLKFLENLSWVQIPFHGLMLFIGLYVGILLLFYALPVAAEIVEEFLRFYWVRDVWYSLTHHFFSSLWTIPTFGFLFVLSVTLFIAMPSAFTALYIHSGQRILRTAIAHRGRILTFSIILGTFTAWALIFLTFSQQPQIAAFKLLENPVSTNSQRQVLVRQSEKIRKGLVNAYLFPYRYLSPWKKSNVIADIYRYQFDISESLAWDIQNFHNFLISPFLYQGEWGDRKKAQELYAQFFDTPLQKRERKAVQKALQSTTTLDDAKAGVLNINQKKVLLEKQEVNSIQYGDWADVEIHEVYQNQTFEVEEIFYSFSLPESAVITGIWLGDTDNLATRFPFKISPRGAAQKVYNSQVRRVRPVDPALLEQVGPHHYRLRAFPIPPKIRSGENNPHRPTKMHLWLTYQVMRQENQIPLPQLGEKRNIFWTNRTQRFRNGVLIGKFENKWLEKFLLASPSDPTVHQATFDGYQITAEPLSDRDYILPKNQNFAIVIDTSRSMKAHREELKQALQGLQKQGFSDGKIENNEIDLYLTASTGKQPQEYDLLNQFNLKKQVFYGTLSLKEILRQFATFKSDRSYDAILLLTDEGSYELSKDKGDFPNIFAPLWIVHLGGKFPPAYEDKTLATIQDSGGGIATRVPEVLQRIATTTMLQNQTASQVVNVVDGYVWTMAETTNPAEDSNSFAPLAARMLVQGLSREQSGDRLAQLDRIHAIAKQYKIVTPYSSAIVLVNDEQRKALQEAEASADRFKRHVEDGKERLQTPNNPLATSVPEPGIILGLGTIALLFLSRRKILRSNRRS